MNQGARTLDNTRAAHIGADLHTLTLEGLELLADLVNAVDWRNVVLHETPNRP